MMKRRGFGMVLNATAFEMQCAVFDGHRVMHSSVAPIMADDLGGAAAAAVRAIKPASTRRSALLVMEAPWCQVRALRGLPRPKKPRDQQALLQQNAATFFLRHGSPLLIPAPRWLDDTSAVGCAFTESTVTSVRNALASVGTELDAVAAAQALAEPSMEAAQSLRIGDPLVYGLGPRRDFRAGLPVALAAAAGAVLLAIVAPLVAARQASNAFAAELHAPARVATPISGTEKATIHRRALAIQALFRAHRSPTLLLAQLANALPEETRVEALRVDSSSASLTVTTNSLDDVLTRLERMDRGVSVDIAGQVSRVAGTNQERATIVIRWRVPGPGSAR